MKSILSTLAIALGAWAVCMPVMAQLSIRDDLNREDAEHMTTAGAIVYVASARQLEDVSSAAAGAHAPAPTAAEPTKPPSEPPGKRPSQYGM